MRTTLEAAGRGRDWPHVTVDSYGDVRGAAGAPSRHMNISSSTMPTVFPVLGVLGRLGDSELVTFDADQDDRGRCRAVAAAADGDLAALGVEGTGSSVVA